MSSPRTHDDGLAPEARNSPMVGVGYNIATFLAWLGEDRRNPIMTGLGCALCVALLALFVVTSRPAAGIVASETGTEPVYATAEQGEDLGDVGKPHGKTRLEMIALNEGLIVSNTAKCDELGRTTGICARIMFAGRELAWDALWAGDRVIVGFEQVELPTAMTNIR